jgi:hypothetical protein
MGRALGTGLVAVVLLTACSSGGNSAAKTTTTSTTTTTTLATTTTTDPKDAVKQAYLDYWTMIDRLGPAPNPDDPELAVRTANPLLTSLRDDMSTRQQQGRRTRLPDDPALNAHRVDQVSVTEANATVDDCFVDGRIAEGSDGSINDAVVTKHTSAKLVLVGSDWKVTDVQFVEKTNGVAGCAASN